MHRVVQSIVVDMSVKITDLPDNCLEKVFRWLNIKDLLNLADANKKFKTAADLAYMSNFGKAMLFIDGFDPAHTHNSYSAVCFEFGYVFGHRIRTSYLKPTFQILRSFGHLISKLKIHIRDSYYEYYLDAHDDDSDVFQISFSRVFAYIHEYAETLTGIEIRTSRYLSNDFFNFLEKPFPNVENISIELYRWPKNSVKNLFPKLRMLKCSYRKHSHVTNIMEQFPHLEQIEFKMISRNEEQLRVAKDDTSPVYSFLNLNLHLRSLVITLIPDTRLFQCISNMPQLINLVFRGPDEQYLSQITGGLFLYPQIRRFEFHTENSQSSNFLSRLPTFAHLEEAFLSLSIFRDDFHSFIIKHPSIEKLTLASLTTLNELNVPEMAKSLQYLKEIDIRHCNLSVDQLIHVISHFKSLNIIRFRAMDNHTLTTYQSYLGNQWQGSQITRDLHFPSYYSDRISLPYSDRNLEVKRVY